MQLIFVFNLEVLHSFSGRLKIQKRYMWNLYIFTFFYVKRSFFDFRRASESAIVCIYEVRKVKEITFNRSSNWFSIKLSSLLVVRTMIARFSKDIFWKKNNCHISLYFVVCILHIAFSLLPRLDTYDLMRSRYPNIRYDYIYYIFLEY